MSKKRSKLSRKLSRTLMVLAIPIFVLTTGSFFNHSQDLIRQESMERLNNILNTTVLRVSGFMTTVETAAKSNTWMIEEHFSPDSLMAVCRRIVQLNSSVISCTVSTEPNSFPEFGPNFSVYTVDEGDTIVTVRETDFDYYDREWYETTRKTGKASWVTPFSDFMEGYINYKEAVASYCVPLRSKHGRISGVVSVDFSFEALSKDVFDMETPYSSSYYILIDGDGRYLIHPETSLLFKKTIFSEDSPSDNEDMKALGREMTEGNKGMMHVKIGDKLCYVCYAPVPDTNWSMALICHEDEVLEDYQHLAYYIVGFIIVGLVLIWLLAYRVVRRNIKPVNELLEITNQIAEGNYDVKIPESNRKDSVSQMQNGFILMRRALASHRDEAKRAAEELKEENEKLEKAMQLAEKTAKSKGAFVDGVVEQIHKPITIVEGLVNVWRSSLVARDAGKKLQAEEMTTVINTMKFNATRLRRMSQMLWDSSDTRAADDTVYLKTDDVSCNVVARECIEHTKKLFPSLVFRMESELPDSLCIRSNYLYVTRTLRELLYNSAKYSDGLHISLCITRTENTVRFTIEDVGQGIPEEMHDTVFLPFMKVKNMTDGIGLGLPLCKRHVTSLGGDLIFDASYKQGCRMIVELPK